MSWSHATAMVRYFMGGDEALNSDSSSRKAALAARWDVIQQRHERLIKHTFGAWTMRFFESHTLSEKYIYYWYSMERRSEEKHLMRILFANLKIIASKHGDAAARNYLFGHWLLRLRSTLSPMDGLDTPIFFCAVDCALTVVAKKGGLDSRFETLQKASSGKKSDQ